MEVLIVLDDVDQKGQIKKLAGKCSWFGSGSRIIITTRDRSVMEIEQERSAEHIMKLPGDVRCFEMREMELDIARLLFCRHAFGKDFPTEDYCDICEEVVAAIGDLPLALEITASYLNNKPRFVWEDTIEKLLKDMPHQVVERNLRTSYDAHQVVESNLRTSYDALAQEAQQMFLDIACFFHGTGKTMPIYMWSASEFLPDQRIVTLIFLSLVKIVDGDKLWMHDFGRKIVLQENAMDPAKRSRLWGHEEILQVLWKKEDEMEEEREEEEGTIEALGLCLCYDDFLWNINFTRKELERLPKLRFLELCGFQFSGELEGSLSNLRWLSWHFFPSSVDASNLNLKNLVILDLSRSNIDDLWPGWTEIGVKRQIV